MRRQVILVGLMVLLLTSFFPRLSFGNLHNHISQPEIANVMVAANLLKVNAELMNGKYFPLEDEAIMQPFYRRAMQAAQEHGLPATITHGALGQFEDEAIKLWRMWKDGAIPAFQRQLMVVYQKAGEANFATKVMLDALMMAHEARIIPCHPMNRVELRVFFTNADVVKGSAIRAWEAVARIMPHLSNYPLEGYIHEVGPGPIGGWGYHPGARMIPRVFNLNPLDGPYPFTLYENTDIGGFDRIAQLLVNLNALMINTELAYPNYPWAEKANALMKARFEAIELYKSWSRYIRRIRSDRYLPIEVQEIKQEFHAQFELLHVHFRNALLVAPTCNDWCQNQHIRGLLFQVMDYMHRVRYEKIFAIPALEYCPEVTYWNSIVHGTFAPGGGFGANVSGIPADMPYARYNNGIQANGFRQYTEQSPGQARIEYVPVDGSGAGAPATAQADQPVPLATPGEGARVDGTQQEETELVQDPNLGYDPTLSTQPGDEQLARPDATEQASSEQPARPDATEQASSEQPAPPADPTGAQEKVQGPNQQFTDPTTGQLHPINPQTERIVRARVNGQLVNTFYIQNLQTQQLYTIQNGQKLLIDPRTGQPVQQRSQVQPQGYYGPGGAPSNQYYDRSRQSMAGNGMYQDPSRQGYGAPSNQYYDRSRQSMPGNGMYQDPSRQGYGAPATGMYQDPSRQGYGAPATGGVSGPRAFPQYGSR